MLDPPHTKKICNVQGKEISNPLPARDAQRTKTHLVPTRTVFECLLQTYGSTMACRGAGALGAVDLGMAKAPLEEVTINPTIDPPELTQD